MKYHRFEEASVLIVDTMPASQETIANCLRDLGFRKIAFCRNSVEARERLALGNIDLMICDAYLADGDIAAMVRDLRELNQRGDAFLPIVSLTWQPTIEVIHRVVNAGSDLILTLPISFKKISNAVETLIERRKNFVVTSTYIGPDRRKNPRPGAQEAPQIKVPNALRHRVTGDDGDVNPADILNAIREMRVERSAARISHSVGMIVSTAKVRKSADIGRLISELQFTANDLNRRIGDTRYAHERALSGSLCEVVNKIAEQGDVLDSDLELLPQLALALELAMGQEDANSVEAALDISRAVRRLPFAAE